MPCAGVGTVAAQIEIDSIAKRQQEILESDIDVRQPLRDRGELFECATSMSDGKYADGPDLQFDFINDAQHAETKAIRI